MATHESGMKKGSAGTTAGKSGKAATPAKQGTGTKGNASRAGSAAKDKGMTGSKRKSGSQE